MIRMRPTGAPPNQICDPSPEKPIFRVGLTVGIDLASRPDAVGRRGYDVMTSAFHDHDLMLRAIGDTLAMSPPLIVSEAQIGEMFDKLAKIIKAAA